MRHWGSSTLYAGVDLDRRSRPFQSCNGRRGCWSSSSKPGQQRLKHPDSAGLIGTRRRGMLRVSDLSIIKSNTDTTCIDSQASQLGMGKRIVRGRKRVWQTQGLSNSKHPSQIYLNIYTTIFNKKKHKTPWGSFLNLQGGGWVIRKAVSQGDSANVLRLLTTNSQTRQQLTVPRHHQPG